MSGKSDQAVIIENSIAGIFPNYALIDKIIYTL
jgi:hypothetical protein